MLTFFKEKTSSLMGNGPAYGEKNPTEEFTSSGFLTKSLSLDGLNRKNNANDLIFFAGTDKARVITEILEERGWARTKDHRVTNFTIKWCLAREVDWDQFQEGKQLINNIPGQLVFADKINLWYSTRDYLSSRRCFDGNHIQAFLPMTFILDDENEVAGFLRSYKKHVRTWICKPRYSYAGRGIYVVSGSSDLNTIFKFKVGTHNRLQYEPRLPGYLMQEYIARPLLIKNRKFDIRVHWLVAWTKPLLVFYNHNASVVRLSLNPYRELDFDRATHLTNLSVQENHSRYALQQEATGMSIYQLNHYFNTCFRPFHPKMCQDWVMTVMQERMQTIIRHVIRASKDKLTRGAGQFGLFGCDFLLDENFRIWLLEINDNPGVGWGNSRLNTSTRPLFEETLDIVFECFEKYRKDQPILPIQCLRNYQLIYNEDDDADRISFDDNQVITERLSIRYAKKDTLPRTPYRRILPRVSTSRASTYQNDNTSDINNPYTTNSINIALPLINTTNTNSSVIDTIASPSPSIVNTTPVRLSSVKTAPLNLSAGPTSSSLLKTTPLNPSVISSAVSNPSGISSISANSSLVTTTPFSSITINTTDDTVETSEPLKHDDDDIELECLMNPKEPLIISTPKPLVSTASFGTRPIIKINKTSVKRTLSVINAITIQQKKRNGITPMLIDSRRYIYRQGTILPYAGTTTKKDKFFKSKTILNNNKQEKIEKEDNPSALISSTNDDSSELFCFN